MYKYLILVLFLCLFGFGCANHDIVKPEYNQDHKARDLETDFNVMGSVQDESLGVKKGDLIVQRKMLLSENLRDLQIEVYTLQAEVYGVEQYGSVGWYGLLKECRMKLSDKRNGGTGTLIWTEQLDRLADKEQDSTVGLDERKNLVSISEEYISDRITRFKDYKKILLERRNRIKLDVDVCNTALNSQMYDNKLKAVYPLEIQPKKTQTDFDSE